jgi:hypothetical protein
MGAALPGKAQRRGSSIRDPLLGPPLVRGGFLLATTVTL